MKNIKIGLIGWGTVGTGVIKILEKNREVLSHRLGKSLELIKIADIDVNRPRGIRVDPSILTSKPEDIIDDPSIDVVVELTGSVDEGEKYILKSLENKKSVVTANKALLARSGKKLLAAAEKAGRGLFFEASVGGGIPIVKALREGLAANKIESILGIINGTSNYVLDRMQESGKSFREAVREAQEKGYAEADPSLDLQGGDSAHKLIILAFLAFGGWVDLKDVYVEGIASITSQDIDYTDDLGYKIKLLAIAKQLTDGVEIRVHPTLVHHSRLLASVGGIFNAVYLEGDFSGQSLFYGEGAGEGPAASAVVGDIIEAGREIIDGSYPCRLSADRQLNVIPIGEMRCRHYLRVPAVDHPGVLAQIATILGQENISISSVIQRGRRGSDVVPVILMTDLAREKSMNRAVEKIGRLDIVKGDPLRIRVEG